MAKDSAKDKLAETYRENAEKRRQRRAKAAADTAHKKRFPGHFIDIYKGFPRGLEAKDPMLNIIQRGKKASKKTRI